MLSVKILRFFFVKSNLQQTFVSKSSDDCKVTLAVRVRSK